MRSLHLGSSVVLSTGFAMPLLGFGVYKNYTTTSSVLEALKAGYRHIDTAQAYRNEAHVGSALKESGLRREDVFITTKVISKHHGRAKTLQVVESSLESIGGGYIDLFLIHDPYAGTHLRLETYEALQDCRKEGKIRSVGVSNYGVKHLEEIREAGYETPVVNQLEVNIIFNELEGEGQLAYWNNIVVSAYSPLLQGGLDHPVLQSIARKHNKDVAQILIRWSLQKGFVPLPKSATPARIHSNTQVYDFDLDRDDMDRMDQLDKGKDGALTWNPVDAD